MRFLASVRNVLVTYTSLFDGVFCVIDARLQERGRGWRCPFLLDSRVYVDKSLIENEQIGGRNQARFSICLRH